MTRRIAIIGAATRFPAVAGESFWESLEAQRDLVSEVDPSRWDTDLYRHPDRRSPGTSVTFAAGSLGDVRGFDAEFFGISPREAANTDPQQRLLLELAWEAMEHAGVPPSTLRGSRTGVYIGISSIDYAYRHTDDLEALDSTSATGNTFSIAANRLSYVFDFTGPSMVLDTACSSSLVAFHQACQAIRHGECDIALTGGVSLHLHPFGFIAFSKAKMLSSGGRCRPFDADGDGYVRSEGAGLFLLKALDQALADGDCILAEVAGSAVNTDGHKAGLTVPSADAQATLLREVYAGAGLAAEEIDYLEAHGTGTPVGDPIETRAIGEALGRHRRTPLPIGSVKSNVGHLETAAGTAGLSKALYCLSRRRIPATIGITSLNPHLELSHANLDIVTQARPLPAAKRLVIGINSFGFGGANAHVILTSAPDALCQPRTAPGPRRNTAARLPLLLSARGRNALLAQAECLAEHLAQHPDRYQEQPDALYDLAYTLCHRRDALTDQALAFVANADDALARLRGLAAGDATAMVTDRRLDAPQGPVFVYTGNGCQWIGMGRTLLADHSLFAATIDRLDALFMPLGGFSLRETLARADDDTGDGYAITEIAQPALFAVQVGLTEVLRQAGVTPSAVIGHSVGEVAAAWACGALGLEDAVTVIARRSQAQGLTRGLGTMTAVACGAEEILPWLERPAYAAICLAGHNSHRGITLAGPATDLDDLERALADDGIASFRLDLDYPFHSPAMDRIRGSLVASLSSLAPGRSRLPLFSTVTASVIDGSAMDADYWWRNVRYPVRFAEAVDTAIDAGHNVFVEIGAHPVLRRYLDEQCQAKEHDARIITTQSRQGNGLQELEAAQARLWLHGARAPLTTTFPQPGRRLDLPTYPWQRQPLWLTPSGLGHGLLERREEHPLLGHRRCQDPHCWTQRLDTTRQPWLADHRVAGIPVFPAAAYVEQVLAAALLRHPASVVEITDMEILAPLLLDAPFGRQTRLRVDDQGRVSIDARELDQPEAWQAHVQARLAPAPLGLMLNVSAPERPAGAPPITLDHHLAAARRRGLDYGPAFQWLAGGWRVDGEIIAELTPPPADDLGVHLPPGALDAALQLFLPLLEDDSATTLPDMGFLPVRIGRLQFNANAGRPRWARAVLRQRSPHSFCADLWLYDGNDRCVAALGDVRFKAAPQGGGEAPRQRHIRTVLTPAPQSMSNAPATPLGDSASLERMAKTYREASGQHYGQEIGPLLDRLSDAFAEAALDRLGFGSELPETALPVRGNRYGAWQELVSQLMCNESLTLAAHGWTRSREEDAVSAEAIWQLLFAEAPEQTAALHLIGRHGLHLADLLEGSLEGETLGIHDDALAGLVPCLIGEHGWQCLMTALVAALEQSLATLPPGQRLGVIEAGVAGPRLGEALAHGLDPDRLDLHLMPLGAEACQRAKQLVKRHPRITQDPRQFSTAIPQASLSTSPLPAANTGPDQPASPGAWSDLPPRVQLAWVVPACHDLAAGLAMIDIVLARMAPGGTVVILVVPPSRWWAALAATPGLPSTSTLCTPEALREHLQANHTATATTVRLEEGPYGAQLLHLSVASASPPQGRPQPCRVLAADPGSRALAERLQARLGQDTWVCTDEATLTDRLADIERTGAAQSWEVIDLRGMATGASTNAHAAANDAHPAQHGATAALDRCEQLAQWPQRLARLAHSSAPSSASSSTLALRIVTRGAALSLDGDGKLAAAEHGPEAVPGNDRADPQPTPLSDVVAWGFARSLANELPGIDVGLIDLPFGTIGTGDDTVSDGVIDALARQLETADAESEVVLDHRGRRWATRLRSFCPDAPTSATSGAGDDASVLSLTIDQPGQLKRLNWVPKPLAPLGPDEVEVRVLATGLNFRDVMYTLGLLSDEALENGFAGATLGLEFSGIVERCGAAVTTLAVGQAVAGFGPASFSNRLIAPRHSVAPVPQGIDVLAAATIPTAFFTVYYALVHVARLQPGERVLIHGAAGGVGLAAIQVAQRCGADIHATAGTAEKRDLLRLLGVAHRYDSRGLDFAERILDVTDNRGVDVVLNCLSGDAIHQNLRILSPFGRFLELGKRDFYSDTDMGLRPFRHNLSYFGIDSDQIMKHRPALTHQLFQEVMARFKDGSFFVLPYTAFSRSRVIDAFRYMQQSRQIGKVLVVEDTRSIAPGTVEKPPTTLRPSLALDPDGAYLVTGGSSGFGLATATWLATRGARQLILLSRRGPISDEAITAIQAIEALGTKVHAPPCDITDAEALGAVIGACGRTLPPLKGVIHAAAVIDDALIAHLDTQQIRRVLWPKLVGAELLERLTRHLTLDMFVMFSSATTLFGNPGQAAYVAANLGLEGLARRRRQHGQPALCIAWGIIEDVGFLARHTATRHALQKRLGSTGLSADGAHALLEQHLLQGWPDGAILTLDDNALARALPTWGKPRFSELAGLTTTTSNDGGEQALRSRLATMNETDRLACVVTVLSIELAAILMIDADTIDAHRSVYELGFDSLMGVELVTAIDARLAVKVPAMALAEAATLTRIARLVLERLDHTDAGDEHNAHAERHSIAHRHGGETAFTMADTPEIPE